MTINNIVIRMLDREPYAISAVGDEATQNGADFAAGVQRSMVEGLPLCLKVDGIGWTVINQQYITGVEIYGSEDDEPTPPKDPGAKRKFRDPHRPGTGAEVGHIIPGQPL